MPLPTPDELYFLRAWRKRGEECEHKLALAKKYIEAIRDHSGSEHAATMARKALKHLNREETP